MNEEFEKFWTKHTTIVATLRSPKDYAQHVFESGQAAEREAIAQYIVDQGTIQIKDGASVCYIDNEDVSLIRSGKYGRE